jgi:hypothetical protein
MSSLIQDFPKNEKLSKTVYMPPESYAKQLLGHSVVEAFTDK